MKGLLMEDVRELPPGGEQLELWAHLEGDDFWRGEPWEGRSPRVLTRLWKTFSLGAPPMGGLIRNVSDEGTEKGWSDPDQLLLFVQGEE